MVVLHKLANNFHKVEINNIKFWFSYDTCIAFEVDNKTIISENVWSKTTAKHINQIYGSIITNEEFIRRLSCLG